LIERIRTRARVRSRDVRIAIGDDAAVLRGSEDHEALVTTDLSIEGVHFRRDWHSPESIGHRCLARGLSDIAAMGGTPTAAFLSLACPQGIDPKWLDRFFDGLLRLAKRFGVALAGGDTALSPTTIIADIMVIGRTEKNAAVLRSSARVGDQVYVTGILGGAARDLHALIRGERKLARDSVFLWPEPQVKIGRKLRTVASAMIDTSDGLSVDLAHVCLESHVSAIIDAERIPIAQGASLEDALHGGEDYQLLLTASRKTRVPRLLFRIGEIVSKKRHPVYLKRGAHVAPLPQRGWQHEM
jgi:thiamine-monophosphate kinase